MGGDGESCARKCEGVGVDLGGGEGWGVGTSEGIEGEVGN